MVVAACSLLSWILLLWVLPALLYLGALAALSARQRAARLTADSQRFVVVVPAHNESVQIAQTVESLLTVDYPKDRFEVWVVADNCTDDTAQVAGAAGAQVLVRQHDTEKGKGYALNFAFERAQAKGQVDAVVVVDADTVVNKTLLRAFAARLVDGELAIQAEYGVRNPFASWRTRLMAVALGMFHRVRGIARERLGLSAGLRGNGMCFSLACLQRFPHKAFGLVEDVEYGIALGMGGVRVAYADDAQVLGEMVSSGKQSESQRDRWEDGRKLLRRQQVPALLGAAIARRSLLLLDLAIDLAIPPLGRLVALLLVGTAALVARVAVHAMLAEAAVGAWDWQAAWTQGQGVAFGFALGWASLLLYVLRGMALSHLGFGAVTAMLGAPVYLAWKLLLAFRPKRKEQAWVRTAREGQHKPPP